MYKVRNLNLKIKAGWCPCPFQGPELFRGVREAQWAGGGNQPIGRESANWAL